MAALLMTGVAALVAAAAFAIEHGPRAFARPAELGLFALAGLIAPGASQVFFTRAVRDAGPSRTSVVVGRAPLFAVAIAIVALGEPIKPPLLIGAGLIVLAGVVLASESQRPAHVRLTGIVFALVATLLFSTRDNLVRHLAGGAQTGSVAAAASALAFASLAMLVDVALARRGRVVSSLRALNRRPLVVAGCCFGLS